MRFLILFIFLISNSFANEAKDINNLVINKELIKYDNITFINHKNKQVNLKDYNGKLVMLNFWATWCAPCKKEMPSLYKLSQDKKFKNLEVLAINMEQPNKLKTKKFFDDLNINNLKIYFDPKLNFVKEFKLRGVPTTVLVNKKGEEFARIIGEVDFEEKKFLKWLLNYD